MPIKLRWLRADDADLAEIAARLNAADSEVSIKQFTAESLRRFVGDPSRFYLIATINDQLAGALHGYVHLHPTGVTYAYVDEVDTVKAFRRQGVATAMLKQALETAKEQGASELWLGTDEHNDYAEKFYDTLSPTEIEPGKIYTWNLSDRSSNIVNRNS